MSQQPAVRASARTAPRPVARPVRRAAPLRVVPGAIQRTNNVVFAGICVALMVSGLVALLMLNTSLAQGAFALSELKKTSGQLTDTQQQLTASIDDRRAPRSLAAAAQGMGLVPSHSMAFIRLSDGQVIGTAKPADPAARLEIITSPAPPPRGPGTPGTSAAPAATPARAAAPARPATPARPAASAAPAGR